MSSWFFNYKNFQIGALTNKSFSFELRNWESEQIISFDPTESFGHDLKLISTKYQIIQVEPSYFKRFYRYAFINNKSRYFFDGLQNMVNVEIPDHLINHIYISLVKTLYLSNINCLKIKIISFLYFYYDNINLEILCLLSLLKQRYFFIKLKNITSQKIINNLESNIFFSKVKLNKSTFCLLININSRFENTNFNLQLKQRTIKGNFKLFSISSFLNSTININSIGTAINFTKLIVEGLHPICQTLIHEKNPNIVFNSQFLKLKNNGLIFSMLENLKRFVFYCKLNVLTYSIYESGINLISNIFEKNSKILINFNSIYLINLRSNIIIENILNIKLLYYYIPLYSKVTVYKKMCITQNDYFKPASFNKKLNYMSYFYLPSKNFYQDSNLFVNIEGLIKKSPKLFISSKVFSNWKLLRIFFTELTIELKSLEYFNSFLINFNLKTRFNFLKLVFLLYLAENISNINYTINNSNFFFKNKALISLYKKIKFVNIKMTFLLNDFYLNKNDFFSNNSTILLKLAKITNLQSTNFF